MTPTQHQLLASRKTYSKCAAVVEARIRASGFTHTCSEQVAGVGVACDWLRRAAEMRSIEYVGGQLNDSRRRKPFVELLRYGHSWFALNAIFTRPALLDLVGKPAGAAEFDAFTVLYDAARIADAAGRTMDLHRILATPTTPRLPGRAVGTTVTTLAAIQAKYLPSKPNGKTGKLVAEAAVSGNFAALTLPRLVYAFRNWSVHGNALDGSFGSRPAFERFVEILAQVLAEVHGCAASTLLSRL